MLGFYPFPFFEDVQNSYFSNLGIRAKIRGFDGADLSISRKFELIIFYLAGYLADENTNKDDKKCTDQLGWQ